MTHIFELFNKIIHYAIKKKILKKQRPTLTVISKNNILYTHIHKIINFQYIRKFMDLEKKK